MATGPKPVTRNAARQPQYARAVGQPLCMHPVAGAVHIATGDPFMRLHQVKFAFRERRANGTPKTPVAPGTAGVKRIAAHKFGGLALDCAVVPVARKHGDVNTLVPQCPHRARNKALAAAIRVISLPDKGDVHASISGGVAPAARTLMRKQFSGGTENRLNRQGIEAIAQLAAATTVIAARPARVQLRGDDAMRYTPGTPFGLAAGAK